MTFSGENVYYFKHVICTMALPLVGFIFLLGLLREQVPLRGATAVGQ